MELCNNCKDRKDCWFVSERSRIYSEVKLLSSPYILVAHLRVAENRQIAEGEYKCQKALSERCQARLE